MNPESSKLYCVWAHAGLALHNSGRALLCCHSRLYFEDDNKQKIYWHTHRLDDAWRSSTRREIQQALDAGEQHFNCAACWDEEAAGRESRRTYTNKMFSIDGDPETPRLMDLKLGNTCNLACRMCWPEVSSKWYRDYFEVYEKHRDPNADYKIFLQRWGSIQDSYNRDNTEFWEDLRRFVAGVVYFDIYGAEPMLLDRLFDILDYSTTTGYSTAQKMHINTNATTWNQDYMDILCKFQEVTIDLSLDALGAQAEYIRYGESWSRVLENLSNYRQLKKQNSNILINVCVTVNPLNVFYLPEIWEFFFDEFPDFGRFFNLVHMPEHMCIRSLPDSIKTAVYDKLMRGFDRDVTFLKLVQGVADFMMLPMPNQSKHWDEFMRSTQELDRVRSQDLRATFPEFCRLIDQV